MLAAGIEPAQDLTPDGFSYHLRLSPPPLDCSKVWGTGLRDAQSAERCAGGRESGGSEGRGDEVASWILVPGAGLEPALPLPENGF